MKLSRDSVLLTAGIIAAVILGLASLTTGDPNDPTSLAFYGIPAKAAPYLRLAALVVGIISAKLSSTPLASKAQLRAADPSARIL